MKFVNLTLEEIDAYLLTQKGITINIFDALYEINTKLNNIPELKWAVVGSMATVIQGVNIIPEDIDIWISRSIDVEKVMNCFIL